MAISFPAFPAISYSFLRFCCYEDVGVIEPIKMAANCGESVDLSGPLLETKDIAKYIG